MRPGRARADGRMALTTVGIPAYQGEDTLGRALDSVLCQTVRDIEVLVSDDASQDGPAGGRRRYSSGGKMRSSSSGRSSSALCFARAVARVCSGQMSSGASRTFWSAQVNCLRAGSGWVPPSATQ